MFIESGHLDTSRRTDLQNEDNYLHSLGFRNEDEFLQWLGNDIVLDIGSGYGTLAKNVAKKKRQAQVVSLNPSLSNRKFREESRLKTKELVNEGDVESEKFLNQAHEKLAVAGRWDRLPFRDASFSKVLSSYAFPMYCKNRSELQATVKELKRVLKPGGEARINAPKSHSITNKDGMTITRDKFYVTFKKMLEEEGLVVKEMAEYNPETEAVVRLLGGGRLQTVDQPFFISINKPETEQPNVNLNDMTMPREPLIQISGGF